MTLTPETRAPVGARERPIIFSGPMVRAILAGRKTQTRRVIKPPRGVDPGHWMPDAPGTLGAGIYGDRVKVLHWPNDGAEHAFARLPCAKGDRLWVKETHMFVGGGDPGIPLRRADWRDDATRQGLENIPAEEPKGWRSSLFMPRWVSRLTLEVTEVRVERLQDISHEDAAAEGLIAERTPAAGILRNVATDKCTPITRTRWQGAPDLPLRGMERTAYRDLWNSIHGKDAWDANPWVAAITFRLLPANESQNEGAAV